MLRDHANLPGDSALPASVMETLWKLIDSAFEFHLTGSHFFGCARKDSDIDFIVQYSENVVAWLEDIGFELLGTHYDKANLTKDTVGVYELGTVHIQVVKDASVICAARDILSTHFPVLHKDTRGLHRRDMWNCAINLVKGVRRAAAEYKLDLTFDSEL